METRRFRILTGLTSILFFFSATVLGVKWADGAFKPVYQIEGVFAAAGQGLIQDSDVKIHGVNVGRVAKVRFAEGQALVRMDINAGERIPASAKAVIRPKTLFGEKFVDIDPGDAEAKGPFLRDEQTIKDTLGGFELERVLADLYPILKAVQPDELAVIVDTLGEGGRGQGEAINRQLANFATLAQVQAENAGELSQFLVDLARLSDELARRSGDVVGAAEDLNVALPPLNARGDKLAVVLDQASRLSGDLADVLEANRPFLDKSASIGGKTVQLLYDNRAQVGPLVTGLRQFVQLLAEVGRIPYGDGTTLAAVKFVSGEDCETGRFESGCGAPTPTSASAAGDGATPPVPPGGTIPTLPRPVPSAGTAGLIELFEGLLS